MELPPHQPCRGPLKCLLGWQRVRPLLVRAHCSLLLLSCFLLVWVQVILEYRVCHPLFTVQNRNIYTCNRRLLRPCLCLPSQRNTVSCHFLNVAQETVPTLKEFRFCCVSIYYTEKEHVFIRSGNWCIVVRGELPNIGHSCAGQFILLGLIAHGYVPDEIISWTFWLMLTFLVGVYWPKGKRCFTHNTSDTKCGRVFPHINQFFNSLDTNWMSRNWIHFWH